MSFCALFSESFCYFVHKLCTKLFTTIYAQYIMARNNGGNYDDVHKDTRVQKL